MFSITFLKDTAERVLVTFAQALIAAGVALPGDYLEGDVLQIAAGAAILSLLKAVVASRLGSKDTASLVN